MSLCRTGYAPAAGGFLGLSLESESALGVTAQVLIAILVLLCVRRIWLELGALELEGIHRD